jgi:hypothetical protein
MEKVLKTRALQAIELTSARMVKLVDTRDLKSRGLGRVRAGSSPAPGTKINDFVSRRESPRKISGPREIAKSRENSGKTATYMTLNDQNQKRPAFGGTEKFQNDPHWRDLIPFHEYFHGDNGAGIGASHQTGWTGLIAKLIQQYAG